MTPISFAGDSDLVVAARRVCRRAGFFAVRGNRALASVMDVGSYLKSRRRPVGPIIVLAESADALPAIYAAGASLAVLPDSLDLLPTVLGRLLSHRALAARQTRTVRRHVLQRRALREGPTC